MRRVRIIMRLRSYRRHSWHWPCGRDAGAKRRANDRRADGILRDNRDRLVSARLPHAQALIAQVGARAPGAAGDSE